MKTDTYIHSFNQLINHRDMLLRKNSKTHTSFIKKKSRTKHHTSKYRQKCFTYMQEEFLFCQWTIIIRREIRCSKKNQSILGE